MMLLEPMEASMEIRGLCWEGYDDPSVLEPFTRHGDAVRIDNHISDHAATQCVLERAGHWDLVNINSPFVRDALHPRGRIRELDAARFESPGRNRPMSDAFSALHEWGIGRNGSTIGVCQRFGPFNLVVDTRAVSVSTAEDEGFRLAYDAGTAGRYGILAYDDFNVMHIAIDAGLDPFQRQSAAGFATFAATAARWFGSAALVTSDHHALNRGLVDGAIDFYLGGGIYTASCARRDGHAFVRGVTPRKRAAHGPGAIAFVEVNAVLADAPAATRAEALLEYLLQPQSALRAALAGGAANPVLQMSDPQVLALFSRAMLDAMQWDTLEEELARCAQYRIVPDYDKLHAILMAARATTAWPARVTRP
jgi:spermidine/putrescine transport system substrate-binding protein